MRSQTNSILALPDVNVVVALLHPNHVHHLLAHEWLSSARRFATTPMTESGFLRLALNPRIAAEKPSRSVALSSLQSLRNDSRAVFLEDDTSLTAARIDLAGLSGYRQVTDMHLINLAAANDAVLVTFDRALPETLMQGDRGCVDVIG